MPILTLSDTAIHLALYATSIPTVMVLLRTMAVQWGPRLFLIIVGGLATHFEYNATRKFRPGFSTQISKSDFLKRYAYALHARAGFGEGNSVMVELGQVKKEEPKKGISTTSQYWMIQTHALLSKGFFFLNTIESLTSNISVNSRIIRWGPGIQYFLIQGLEFRMEVFNTRLYSESANTNDRWDLTGQVHLWF